MTTGSQADGELTKCQDFLCSISFYPYGDHPLEETLYSSFFAEEKTGSEPVMSQEGSPWLQS